MSTTHKHTQGSWTVHEYSTVFTPDGSLIHVIPADCMHCDFEKMIANARLIAAAPDLFEALSDFVAAKDAQHAAVYVEDTDAAYEMIDSAEKKARKAIAKATGSP